MRHYLFHSVILEILRYITTVVKSDSKQYYTMNNASCVFRVCLHLTFLFCVCYYHLY